MYKVLQRNSRVNILAEIFRATIAEFITFKNVCHYPCTRDNDTKTLDVCNLKGL